MTSAHQKNSICVVGFDSAWTDSAKSPGAVCAIEIDANGKRNFIAPALATFADALDFVKEKQNNADLCMVAIDQPTIVNNQGGCRPVERLVSSVISFVGGGVQPSNKTKKRMFGGDAPIWRFKNALTASDDATSCTLDAKGLFLVEVFPALGLLSFDDSFFKRLGAPKYNPKNKKKFRIEDWKAVNATVVQIAKACELVEIANWSEIQIGALTPTKSDQDRLDSILCALIGLRWLIDDRSENIMIGDLETGYIISPCSIAVREKLVKKALELGVPAN